MTRGTIKPDMKRRRGLVLIELIVAVGILALIVTAFGTVWWQEQKLARDSYFRAIAMEIVDGEMEALVAGGWKAHPKGSHSYEVPARAAQNLPPGSFTLTVGDKELRLEWTPASTAAGVHVIREAKIR